MSSLFGIGANGAASFYNGVATQSLRFAYTSAETWLARTPSAGNRKIHTLSVWVKRSGLSASQNILEARGSGDTGNVDIWFDNNDRLEISGSSTYWRTTTRRFRDVSSWYHIVIVTDTTDSTAADRLKIYVNGARETSFVDNNHYSQNTDYAIGGNVEHRIGDGYGHFNGYMARYEFIDGIALTPASFGETKNGVWIPKKYTGSYGTNGHLLEFKQSGTSANSSGLGADTSGNDNHYTPTQITGTDSNLLDCPENNFCTWNPLTIGAQGTLSEGNLKNASFWSADLSGNASTFFPESGKWYWEVRVGGAGTYPYIGITSQEKVGYSVNGGTFYNIAWRPDGTGVSDGSSLGTITKENIPSFTNNNIISFALDVDARKIWVAEDNTYADSGNPANGSGENASWTVDVSVSPSIHGYQSQGVGTIANFGQDDTFAGAISSAGNTDGNGKGVFKYAPPSGFLALCTANLPEPTIGPNSATQADDYFNTVLYTGNASPATHTIGFRPNWVWGKKRGTNAQNHWWINDVGNINKWLSSDGTGSEGSEANGTTFNATSFTTANNDLFVNNNSPYVVWAWKGNGTGTAVSNSNGSATSTVSANTAAGFSIVTYTGSTSESVGHGLGVAPKMIIVKDRDATSSWAVYHQGVQNATSNGFLELNSTSAAQTGSNPRFLSGTAGTSQPTSTVFYVNNYSGSTTNNTGNDYVAFCFAEVDGYSKIGSYIGNGNNDGTFVYLGFRPAFIMIKRAVGGTGVYSSWAIYDNKRKTINSDVGTDSNPLFANKNSQEGIRGNGSLSISGTRTAIDFLSNGFKLRDIANEIGVSGNTYIYMAFAEEPFKYANSK
jgi:hypothetical protein